MNKKSLIVSVASVLSVMFLSSCGSSSKMPSIESFVEEKPDVYQFTTSGFAPAMVKSELSNIVPIYFINNNDIPYISVTTGINILYSNGPKALYSDVYSEYVSDTKDNKTVITNKANNSTCTIDYNNQTMEFENYGAFLNNCTKQINPMDTIIAAANQSYFKNVEELKYVAPKEKFTIDFTKYSISLFCKDNEGYIPNEVFSNILNPISMFTLTYLNKNLYVTSESGNSVNTTNRLTLNKILNGSFSSSYMKYCYNLNALTLDVCFGQRSRESRALAGHTITYNIDGYTNLNKHDSSKFLSTDAGVANQALVDTINNEYDDMGHTLYSSAGFLETEAPKSNYGYETNAFVKAYTGLVAARTEKKLSPKVTTENSSAIGDFKQLGDHTDTYVLTMDSFTEPDSKTSYTTQNYYSNTLSLVYNANIELHKNSNIKNLVVDLSLNGGGTGYTALFMSSWLSRGNSIFKTCSFQDNSYSEIKYQADVDGDGDFDSNDYVPNDVNVYLIVSPCSYSCGNLVPCDVRDYCANAKFIGNKSGGGCCVVKANVATGYGSSYQMSSNFVICRKESNENKYVSNDAGAGADSTGDLAIDLSVPSLYYDREYIYSTIIK